MANYNTCLAIQCGALSQDDAGFDTLAACSGSGYVGVRLPTDPLCDQFRTYNSVSIPVLPGYILPPPASVPSVVTPPAEHLTAGDLSMVLPQMPVTVRPPGYCGQLRDVEYVEDSGVVSQGFNIDSFACRVGAWANANPLFAAGVLLAAYYAASKATEKYQRRRAAKGK